MKKFLNISLALVAMVFFLSSCTCYNKMLKNASKVKTSCTPEYVSLKGANATATYTVTFPAKYFKKKAILKVTPVLKYQGGEVAGEPKILQGERIKDNYQAVSYKAGGSYTQTFSVPYTASMKQSVLELKLEGRCAKGSKKEFAAFPYRVRVADGVSTLQAMADDFARLGFTSDSYKRVTQIAESADIMYVVNRYNVRPAQLSSTDIKELQDFLVTSDKDPKKKLQNIETKGYASPEGPLAFNNKLSVNRGGSAEEAVSKKFKKDGTPVAQFDVQGLGEDWEGFQELVKSSDIPDKDLILSVLSMYSDPTVRDKEIRNMSKTFQILEKKILPELRRTKLTANVDVMGLTDDEMKAAVASDINSLKVEEMLFAATLYNDNATKLKIYTAAADKYNDYRAWNNMGYFLAKEGKYADAEKALVKAASINSKDPNVINNLGVVALAQGKPAEAAKFFQNANTADAKYNMGLVALAQGNYAEAAKSLDGYNLALAQYLNGEVSKAKSTVASQNCWAADYLKAVIAASEGNEAGVASNLKAAYGKNAEAKALAATDVNFKKYPNAI